MSQQQSKRPALEPAAESVDASGQADVTAAGQSNSERIAFLGLGLAGMAGCSSDEEPKDDPLAYAIQLLLPHVNPELQDSVDATRLYDLTNGVFIEEAERMNVADHLGLGDTLGPGQLGQLAQKDVLKAFGSEWDAFREHYGVASDITWDQAVEGPVTSRFFTVGYIILQINASVRSDRSDDDAIRFGLGKYHGGRKQMVDAQEQTKEETAFDPLRPHLDDDFEAYVDDAMKYKTP